MKRFFFAFPALLAATVLAPAGMTPLSAQALEEASFVLQIGADTFAIESFTRFADRVEGVIAGQAIGRIAYTLTLAPDASVAALSMRAWQPGAAADAAPAQEGRITLEGDTAIAELSSPTGTRTDRIPTQAGAMLYLNPSFVLIEQMVMRARALGGDSVPMPLFLAQGGQTAEATVARVASDAGVEAGAADSVSISFSGTEFRVEVDPDGRLLGGGIPAQGLTFTRTERLLPTEVRAEPRDYSAPEGAPYAAEEIMVQTVEGHALAGTLTLPRLDGPVPAVVMITGSGAQDRDQAIPVVPGYRPFRQIADTLSRRGIAVLRLDDRGVGASTGDFAAATSEDFADDIRAGLAYLRTRDDIDPDRLALAGHSEGGMIAPMIGTTDPDLRAIVLIAGTAQTGREIIAYQQRESLERNPEMPEASRDSAFAAMQERLRETAATEPWIRFFLDYDPLSTARRIGDTPVLILQGETDRQVTPDQAGMLAEAFREAGNHDVTVHMFPDVNHLLLADPDGSPSGYSMLTNHEVVPDLLGELADWLAIRLDGQASSSGG